MSERAQYERKCLEVTAAHREQVNGVMFYRNVCSRDGRWRGPRYCYSNYKVAIHTGCLHKTPLWLMTVHCIMMVTKPANYVWFVLVFECECDGMVDITRSQIVTIIQPGWYHQSQYSPTVTIPPSHHQHHTAQGGQLGSHTRHVNTNIFDILLTDGVIRATLWHQDLTEELGGWRFPWRYLKMNYSFSFQLYFIGFRVYVICNIFHGSSFW